MQLFRILTAKRFLLQIHVVCVCVFVCVCFFCLVFDFFVLCFFNYYYLNFLDRRESSIFSPDNFDSNV